LFDEEEFALKELQKLQAPLEVKVEDMNTQLLTIEVKKDRKVLNRERNRCM
jgi:hypothetical protein